jgi:hypothetical protein
MKKRNSLWNDSERHVVQKHKYYKDKVALLLAGARGYVCCIKFTF